jgi:alanine racemase
MKKTATLNEAAGSKSDFSTLLLAGQRPTWSEVNLENLCHNFQLMKDAVGKDVAVMVAVKADSYGHGSIVCSRALEQAGVDWFGVALPEEGQQLRLAGIDRPILCLGGFWEGQEQIIVEHALTPALYNLESLRRLDKIGESTGVRLSYHLKVDTGMGRLGVPHAQLGDFLDGLRDLRNVRLDGVLTHLASADSSERREFTQRQMDAFARSVEMIQSHGYNPRWIHQSNSAAAHANPKAQGNMVRLGGVIYGLWQDSTDSSVPPLGWKPVMSLRTRVVLLKSVPKGTPIGYGSTFVTDRESLIATLPIGYEDGLSRGLSNRARVLIRGVHARIVGRISMDLTTLDVTDVAGVKLGDEVTIIGSQGSVEITAAELAGHLGTISYEVTCGISHRVPRIYIGREALE